MGRTLYIINSGPPSRAAYMACRAANIDVDIRVVDYRNDEQHSDWFGKINPRRIVPTLDDDGFCLWESRAIMRYLIDAHASDNTLYPRDLKARARVNCLLDYDASTLYKVVHGYVHPIKFFLEAPDAGAEKKMRGQLAELNKHPHLEAGKYLTGEHLTIADISILATLTFPQFIDYDLSDYPHISGWIQRCKQLPFYEECNAEFEKTLKLSKSPQWEEMMKNRMERLKLKE